MANSPEAGSEQTQTQSKATRIWRVGARLIDLTPTNAQPHLADPNRTALFSSFLQSKSATDRQDLDYVTDWNTGHTSDGRTSGAVVGLRLPVIFTRSASAEVGLSVIAHALRSTYEDLTDPVLGNQSVMNFTVGTDEALRQKSEDDSAWEDYSFKVQPGFGLNGVKAYFTHLIENPEQPAPAIDIEPSSAALLEEQLALPASMDPLVDYRLVY